MTAKLPSEPSVVAQPVAAIAEKSVCQSVKPGVVVGGHTPKKGHTLETHIEGRRTLIGYYENGEWVTVETKPVGYLDI